MALHFRIDSVTKTPADWHINLSIIDDATPTVTLDQLNISVVPTVPASVTAAKNLCRTRFNAVKQLIIDQAATKTQIQTILTSIEQGG